MNRPRSTELRPLFIAVVVRPVCWPCAWERLTLLAKGWMKARARWPSEAKVLRGYWQGFFRGQAMAHNVTNV
jgi:hypothetical protein